MRDRLIIILIGISLGLGMKYFGTEIRKQKPNNDASTSSKQSHEVNEDGALDKEQQGN